MVGTDEKTDVAVIKVEATNLPVVQFADSDAVRVGQFAFAIGAPFKLDYTFTYGVISGKGRSKLLETGGYNIADYDSDPAAGDGTGLGTTLVREGVVVPLEVAHLPYRDGKSYEDFIGEAGLVEFGKKKWRHHVAIVVDLMLHALVADYAVLGGGNVRLLDDLPPRCRRGNNANAFRGGERLWQGEVTYT